MTRPDALAFAESTHTVPGDDGYPFPHSVGDGGLTKREYFAAAAMQGLLAADSKGETGSPRIAAWAVEQAEELIDALNSDEEVQE